MAVCIDLYKFLYRNLEAGQSGGGCSVAEVFLNLLDPYVSKDKQPRLDPGSMPRVPSYYIITGCRWLYSAEQPETEDGPGKLEAETERREQRTTSDQQRQHLFRRLAAHSPALPPSQLSIPSVCLPTSGCSLDLLPEVSAPHCEMSRSVTLNVECTSGQS